MSDPLQLGQYGCSELLLVGQGRRSANGTDGDPEVVVALEDAERCVAVAVGLISVADDQPGSRMVGADIAKSPPRLSPSGILSYPATGGRADQTRCGG